MSLEFSNQITQMEVFPIEVFQSSELVGMDYNRKWVEGYSFYKPKHPRLILYIQVEMLGSQIVPKKDPYNGLYTYVVCRADPSKWRAAFGKNPSKLEGVNFWFLQQPVDDMIPNMHTFPEGTRIAVL